MQLPWRAVETPHGWELQHEAGGWLFELNDRPDRATETDQVFIESQDAIMKFIVRAVNCHHDLLEALTNILPLVEWTVDVVDPLFKAKAERSVASIRAALSKATGEAKE